MIKISILLLWVFSALFLILACNPKTPMKPSSATLSKQESTSPISQSFEKAAWELEWDTRLQTGKKDGRVALYNTSGGEITRTIAPAFKQRYGIDVEAVSGRGAEIAAKISYERRGGLYLADVYMGGIDTATLSLKPQGYLDPLEQALIFPEVKNPQVWYGSGLRWVDKHHTLLTFIAYVSTSIVVNTDFIKPEEIKSFKDLLNPKWKGKIVMNDPTTAGAGLATFGLLGEVLMGWDFWREFLKQEPLITRDQRLQVEWMAQGKYPFGIAPQTSVVTEFKTMGAPLAYVVPAEGAMLGYGSGSVSLINKAPHPNAARVFINWLLSREGQTLYSRAYGVPSARLDVPTEGIDVSKIIQPGMKIFLEVATEEWILKNNDRMNLAREIFAPAMK